MFEEVEKNNQNVSNGEKRMASIEQRTATRWLSLSKPPGRGTLAVGGAAWPFCNYLEIPNPAFMQ
jgi:hypothetical protein